MNAETVQGKLVAGFDELNAYGVGGFFFTDGGLGLVLWITGAGGSAFLCSSVEPRFLESGGELSFVKGYLLRLGHRRFESWTDATARLGIGESD